MKELIGLLDILPASFHTPDSAAYVMQLVSDYQQAAVCIEASLLPTAVKGRLMPTESEVFGFLYPPCVRSSSRSFLVSSEIALHSGGSFG